MIATTEMSEDHRVNSLEVHQVSFCRLQLWGDILFIQLLSGQIKYCEIDKK